MGRTWERNTTGLVVHAAQRSEETRQRVERAIATLLRDQRVVNFNSVAKAAQVTKAYLYGQAFFRERIDALRQEQAQSQRHLTTVKERTDGSKDVLLAAKSRRIRELEEENRRLKRELEVALGKLYEQL